MTHSRRHVVVADDSAASRMILTRALLAAGVTSDRILQAKDGREALEHIERHMPILVLTDLHMPNMGGMELVQALDARGWMSQVTVIAATSTSSQADFQLLFQFGVAAIIRKPFDVRSLAHELTAFLPEPSACQADVGAVP